MSEPNNDEEEQQRKAGIKFNNFLRLAREGVGDYQYGLGQMYEKGLGTAKNEREAVMWYEKAAERGVAVAAWELGSRFYNDRTKPENMVSSYFWFKIHRHLADRKQSDFVTINQGCIEALEKLLTPQQIEDAEQRIFDWLKKYDERVDALQLPEELKAFTGFIPIPD